MIFYSFVYEILDLILCDFENNKCSWSNWSEDGLYQWKRETANALDNANLPGPAGDYLNDKNTYFLYAGDKSAGENSTENGVITVLTSPEFSVEEHPIECFSFWFYFGVSFFIDIPTVILYQCLA